MYGAPKEGHVIRNREDVERARRIVATMFSPLGHKVSAIVNYDNFTIFPDVIDEYSAMVRGLVDRFYAGMTRYTTSSFLRTKLGDALSRRAVEASERRLRRRNPVLGGAEQHGEPNGSPCLARRKGDPLRVT